MRFVKFFYPKYSALKFILLKLILDSVFYLIKNLFFENICCEIFLTNKFKLFQTLYKNWIFVVIFKNNKMSFHLKPILKKFIQNITLDDINKFITLIADYIQDDPSLLN